MRIISIQARYASELSEMPDASARDAALAIECAVSLALLELCGALEMDFVRVEDGADTANAVRAELRRSGKAGAH